jgi:hypothetical protein
MGHSSPVALAGPGRSPGLAHGAQSIAAPAWNPVTQAHAVLGTGAGDAQQISRDSRAAENAGGAMT